MPFKCCVPGCRSNYRNEHKYISCFLFPKDKKLVEKWLKNIGRTNFTPTSSSVVCMKHFTDDCIIWKKISKSKELVLGQHSNRKIKRAILKPNSCPTIFEKSKIESTVTTKFGKIGQNDVKHEIINLSDDEDGSDQLPCRSVEMEPSPKRPRIQAVELSPTPKILPLATSNLLPNKNGNAPAVELSPTPNILPLATSILPNKNGNAPVPPSEPELITGEVTLEDSIIKAIYNRPKLWMETIKGQEDVVEKLWTEVAKEVRRGVYIVKQIWQHLQRKFFEELINTEKLKIKTSNWQYFDRLSFLKLDNQNSAAESSGKESIITVLPAGPKVGNNATFKILMNNTNSINKVINDPTKMEQTSRVPKVPIPRLQKAVNLGNSLAILHTTSTNTQPLANNQSIKIYKNPKMFYKNVGNLGGSNKEQRTFIRIPGKNDLKSGNHKATVASSKENVSFQLPPEKDLTLVASNSGVHKNAESNGRSGLNEPKSPDKSGASLNLLKQTPSSVLSNPQFSKKNVIVVSKDDLAFFNGLLPRVKLLSDSAKQQFRWKVLQVLSEIEKNNLDGKVN